MRHQKEILDILLRPTVQAVNLDSITNGRKSINIVTMPQGTFNKQIPTFNHAHLLGRTVNKLSVLYLIAIVYVRVGMSRLDMIKGGNVLNPRCYSPVE